MDMLSLVHGARPAVGNSAVTNNVNQQQHNESDGLLAGRVGGKARRLRLGVMLLIAQAAEAAPSLLHNHPEDEAHDVAARAVAPGSVVYSTKPHLIYDPEQTPQTAYSSTAPLMLNTSSLLIGGLLALMALLLALATQKDKKSIGSTQRSTPAANTGGRVRWRLGDSSSDDEMLGSKAAWRKSFNNAPAHPSYDGCYYMADPVDDKSPSPQTSRRYFP